MLSEDVTGSVSSTASPITATTLLDSGMLVAFGLALALSSQIDDPDAIVPLGVLTAPAAGETVVDPAFGVTIRRLTAGAEMGNGSTVDYPQLQAVNADETRIYLSTGNGRRVMSTADWTITHQDMQGTLFRWSPIDPDIFYHFNQRGGLPIRLQTTELRPAEA